LPLLFVVMWGGISAAMIARRASRRARAFVGSAPFRRANEELEERRQPAINWSLAAT
jgi:hypothetical protein